MSGIAHEDEFGIDHCKVASRLANHNLKEVAMFARSLSIRLKPNSIGEFTQLMEKEAVPALRKQKGFQNEITLVVPGGSEAVANRSK